MVSRKIRTIPIKSEVSPLLPLRRTIPQVNRGEIKIHANPVQIVKADLARIGEAWSRYQSTSSRNAVYMYLTAVYKVVSNWRRNDRLHEFCALALSLQAFDIDMEPEPFAILIYCTADPAKVDKKTRSKWSRVLRVAEERKKRNETLKEFVKWQGGINNCAALFSRIR